jgi:hypothetical protein
LANEWIGARHGPAILGCEERQVNETSTVADQNWLRV